MQSRSVPAQHNPWPVQALPAWGHVIIQPFAVLFVCTFRAFCACVVYHPHARFFPAIFVNQSGLTCSAPEHCELYAWAQAWHAVVILPCVCVQKSHLCGCYLVGSTCDTGVRFWRANSSQPSNSTACRGVGCRVFAQDFCVVCTSQQLVLPCSHRTNCLAALLWGVSCIREAWGSLQSAYY